MYACGQPQNGPILLPFIVDKPLFYSTNRPAPDILTFYPKDVNILPEA
jgi:hypothetical protein